MNLHILKKKKYNLTSRFLLPSVNLCSKTFSLKILETLGFVNCYLEDEINKNIDNTILLIFQPSIEIHKGKVWSSFLEVISNKIGLLNIYEYDVENRIFGFQLLISTKYQNKLINPFKKGKYSEFPEDYKNLLGDYEKLICKKDIVLRRKKEIYLGLLENYLENIELEEIPEEDVDIKFKYKK